MPKPSIHEQLIGRTIAGKFVVEDVIGSGAMGAVFRARQVALEKTVAIKVLHGEHADDPTFAARFHREAKAASRLNHPNSMQVIDFGAEPDGLLYIAMEYLDGRSLHRVLHEEWPLAPARTADILMQVLAALAVAHDMGVVHRDLKPENVMVLKSTDDDGRPKDLVKVCDFGIAKISDSRAYSSGERDSAAPVTTAGFLVGTPEYMSPEQSRGEKLDPRSDLYSVGVILYQMLCGRVPFEAENAIGVVLKHITEEPRPPSSAVRGIDARLEAICMRALKKAREARYQTSRDMRVELRPIAEGQPGPAPSQHVERPNVTVMTEGPASASAATMQVPSEPDVARPGETKPTLTGTTSAVPGMARGRRLVYVAAATVALTAGAAGVGVFMRKPPAQVVAASEDRSATTGASATAWFAPGTSDTPSLPPLEPTASHAGLHGRLPPSTTSSARPAPTTGPSAIASATATATPIATPIATATATPAATASATPAATSAPAAPEPDPSFEPDKAYVEVGLINAQGVRDSAVRGALRGIGLAGCYRRALRARGSRATGVATLNLSIDDKGVARSAIVTGADFLPGLARCLQGAAFGVRVAQSQVDSSGGTAEVTLAFRSP